MYIHLIKTIVDWINFSFSLGDLTGNLINFLSELLKSLILIPKWRESENFYIFLEVIQPKTDFLWSKQGTKPDKKSAKAFWCTGSLLKASAEHTCLSFKMNKFKILIPFLFFRTSLAERERSLEVHGERKHTSLFLANFYVKQNQKILLCPLRRQNDEECQ